MLSFVHLDSHTHSKIILIHIKTERILLYIHTAIILWPFFNQMSILHFTGVHIVYKCLKVQCVNNSKAPTSCVINNQQGSR